MSIVVISGATIEVFHEVSSLAHWYSVEHVKPEEGMSFGLVGMCVSVLADMYPTHFTPVYVMYWSVVSIKVDQAKEKELNIQVRKFPHSWLAMREYSQVIIDVFPLFQPVNFKSPYFTLLEDGNMCGAAGYKAIGSLHVECSDRCTTATVRDNLADIFTELQDRYKLIAKRIA
jgi:hypothetical protein